MRIPWRNVDWINCAVLATVHLGALAALGWMVFVHFSWATLALALAWGFCCGISITGGYHRHFAHPTYRCSPLVRLFYLLFGAASVQNSALKWASDHRLHHASTDKEEDPYNIRRGFWWAHVGWVLMKSPPPDYANVPDLAADPLVRFQHRFYVLLAILVGLLAPMGIASLWGDALGGLLLPGFLRLAVLYHATFSINSFAHLLGRQPYSTLTSARDSWVTALISLGEGYHNFHHRFPNDYRNGVRAWHFDPTKWWVWTLSQLGLVRDVRKTPRETVEQARLAA